MDSAKILVGLGQWPMCRVLVSDDLDAMCLGAKDYLEKLRPPHQLLKTSARSCCPWPNEHEL